MTPLHKTHTLRLENTLPELFGLIWALEAAASLRTQALREATTAWVEPGPATETPIIWQHAGDNYHFPVSVAISTCLACGRRFGLTNCGVKLGYQLLTNNITVIALSSAPPEDSEHETNTEVASRPSVVSICMSVRMCVCVCSPQALLVSHVVSVGV